MEQDWERALQIVQGHLDEHETQRSLRRVSRGLRSAIDLRGSHVGRFVVHNKYDYFRLLKLSERRTSSGEIAHRPVFISKLDWVWDLRDDSGFLGEEERNRIIEEFEMRGVGIHVYEWEREKYQRAINERIDVTDHSVPVLPEGTTNWKIQLPEIYNASILYCNNHSGLAEINKLFGNKLVVGFLNFGTLRPISVLRSPGGILTTLDPSVKNIIIGDIYTERSSHAGGLDVLRFDLALADRAIYNTAFANVEIVHCEGSCHNVSLPDNVKKLKWNECSLIAEHTGGLNYPAGLEELDISFNIPIGGHTHLDLRLTGLTNLKKISIKNFNIGILTAFPESVEELDLGDTFENGAQQLGTSFFPGVKKLNLGLYSRSFMNAGVSILPDTLVELKCFIDNVGDGFRFPASLRKLIILGDNPEVDDIFNDGLLDLTIGLHSGIEYLEKLPDSLDTLTVTDGFDIARSAIPRRSGTLYMPVDILDEYSYDDEDDDEYAVEMRNLLWNAYNNINNSISRGARIFIGKNEVTAFNIDSIFDEAGFSSNDYRIATLERSLPQSGGGSVFSMYYQKFY